MATPLITVTNIRKAFNGAVVLDGLSLSIDRGEAICIIGESGCGKTTLLRCIGLLEYIDDGLIVYDGQPVVEGRAADRNRQILESFKRSKPYRVYVSESVHRRRLGIVFQSYNLFPNRTVLENVIEGPVYVLGEGREDARRHARELLDRVGMDGREGAYPNELSGGQQQRVAIARALAMRPEVLLFDEITSALDPPRVAALLDVIRKLRDCETPKSMILVTHHMQFAREVASKICFLDAGRIVAQGTPTEVLDHPSNRRLLAFLESIRASQ